jgi:hypothetical protein
VSVHRLGRRWLNGHWTPNTPDYRWPIIAACLPQCHLRVRFPPPERFQCRRAGPAVDPPCDGMHIVELRTEAQHGPIEESEWASQVGPFVTATQPPSRRTTPRVEWERSPICPLPCRAWRLFGRMLWLSFSTETDCCTSVAARDASQAGQLRCAVYEPFPPAA